MKVMVYGGGAVGLGIASCLIKSGVTPHIICRRETAEALLRKGLVRTGIFGEHRAGPGSFRTGTSLKESQSGQCDFILVCTKAHDSHTAAADISSSHRIVGDETKIVLFQNGWGTAEIFSSFFPDEKIYNARVITGFTRPRKHHVHVTVHADAIRMGSLFGGAVTVLGGLSGSIGEGGIPCEPTEEIGKDLWAKMLYNCALNPLGAIFDVPYGVLGEWEHTRHVMEGIVGEVFSVMAGSGYGTHWGSPKEYLAAFYERLLPPTGTHESSMLQDIRAGKRTEIDFLNGAVIGLGRRLGRRTPCNFTVYNMLKFLEERAMARSR